MFHSGIVAIPGEECAVSLKPGLRHVTFARYSVFLASYWSEFMIIIG